MEVEIPDEPLEYGWQPTTLVEIPQELVYSIAMGLEDPASLAARHGFEGEKWEKLQAWKPFQQAVAAQRADFEKTGVTFRLKAALKADMIADKAFVDAMGADVTLLQRLEALKTFAKLGQLEPKEDKAGPAGTTFSISIDLGDKSVQLTANSPKKQPAIDVETKEIPE